MNETNELKEFLKFAIDVSQEAGKITLEYFGNLTEYEVKSDDTPVTIGDRKTEEYIRETLQERYPSHSILGEEFGEIDSKSKYRWIIDPIDGTQSFIRGIPFYSVLLALEIDKIPSVGIIHIPALKETVAAAVGIGCFYNGGPCQVSSTSNLSNAWVQVTDAADLKRRRPKFTEHLLESSYSCRTWGDAYGYLLVATGRVHVMIDPIMSLWDIAPLGPIIKEAGGVFTDLDGNEDMTGISALATNKHLHRQIIEML